MAMILVISDIHGARGSLQKILSRERFASIIFCGDGLNDLAFANIPGQIRVISVTGNCDRASGFRGELSQVLSIEGVNTLVVHGDIYDVKQGYMTLLSSARARSAALVFFGHTHVQYNGSHDGITLVNPGAVKDGHYALCTISNNGVNVILKRLML